jgi:hypothetical protein
MLSEKKILRLKIDVQRYLNNKDKITSFTILLIFRVFHKIATEEFHDDRTGKNHLMRVVFLL